MPSSELLTYSISIFLCFKTIHCHAWSAVYTVHWVCLLRDHTGGLMNPMWDLHLNGVINQLAEEIGTNLEEADVKEREATSVSNIIIRITKHIQNDNDRDPSQTRWKYKQWQWKSERMGRNSEKEKMGESDTTLFLSALVYSWHWGRIGQGGYFQHQWSPIPPTTHLSVIFSLK